MYNALYIFTDLPEKKTAILSVKIYTVQKINTGNAYLNTAASKVGCFNKIHSIAS